MQKLGDEVQSLESRECLFCRTELTGVRTREHIIPQWLLDHLGIRDEAISPWHANLDGSTESLRKHKLADLKEGRVCSRCNNGWMSRLENEAQPILIDLISSQRFTKDLTRSERNIIAHWAMKTAFVLNSGSNYRNTVPQKHFYALSHDNHDQLPTDVLVFAQQHHNTQPFFWLQSSTWQMLNIGKSKTKDLEKFAAQSYKITLQFGKLLLLIAYWSRSNWIPGIWMGIHVPIWPQSKRCILYDSESKFSWNDSQNAIIDFHMGLTIYREYKQNR